MPCSNHPSNTPLPEESVSGGTHAGLIKPRGERHMSLAPQMPATATSRTEANSSPVPDAGTTVPIHWPCRETTP